MRKIWTLDSLVICVYDGRTEPMDGDDARNHRRKTMTMMITFVLYGRVVSIDADGDHDGVMTPLALAVAMIES